MQGEMVYMIEAGKGVIEPYNERLVEQKFYRYSEVAQYLYGESSHPNEKRVTTMNKQQARHAQAMANKIKTHLQAMQWAMNAISEEATIALEQVPIENVTQQFRILERRWEEIQNVLRDMEHELHAS